MVFRRENKADSFQRQMSALRQQIGSPEETSQDIPYEDNERGSERRPAPPSQTDSGRAYQESSAYSFSNFSGDQSSAAMTPAEEGIPPIPEPPTADEQTNVVAHNTTWRGDLETDGSLHVHGKVEGSLRAKAMIYIADEADVDATINADNVIIAGLVRGTIRCTSRFEILPQGRVTADIMAPTFVIHEGANVTGQFRMGAGDEDEQAGPRPAAVVQRRANRA